MKPRCLFKITLWQHFANLDSWNLDMVKLQVEYRLVSKRMGAGVMLQEFLPMLHDLQVV